MKKVFLFLLLITLGSLSAQSFNGTFNVTPLGKPRVLDSDTLKILGIMVNFQEDRDAATFGNGKFGSIYSQNYGSSILDPLPHDRNYFESHLEFVKNYFTKVSDNKLTVDYFILPDTFSVSQTMRNYSPAPKSNDFAPLGNFSQEVWSIANQLYPTFDFSEYDLFIIFHAGVGRDITLPGSLGNERDLPSVYLSENALKEIFGNTFDGFPVNNGNFKITNTAIIPETESRELNTLSGTVLFEITINGLLCATVASHLGLPDLFDTETGLSAIGRFGLMDGQSIFAYNGCYPPEPSAWEKIYLGWAAPVEITPGNYNLNLVTKFASQISDTVILKVPINSSEYYLIENKQRDASSDGSTVKYKVGENTFVKTFLKDTTGYRSFDTDSLAGVVIDIDEFDWALPGSGILIWHIDENIIRQKIAQNKINTDKNLRGVDVEEADGVQDIGEKFYTIFGDEVIGEGTELDLWYRSNPSKLYKNRFDKNSRPSTKSNTGANSLISIYDFSDNANSMSFKVSYGDSIIKPVYYFQNLSGEQSKFLTSLSDNDDIFGFVFGKDLFVYNGNTLIDSVIAFTDYKPVSIQFGGIKYIIGVTYNPLLIVPSKISFWSFDGSNYSSGNFTLPFGVTTAPMIRRTITENYEVLFGTNEGKIAIYDLTSLTAGNSTPKNEILIRDNTSITKVSSYEGKLIASGNFGSAENISSLIYVDGKVINFDLTVILDFVNTIDSRGNLITVLLAKEGNQFEIIEVSEGEIIHRFDLPYSENYSTLALADLKNDGDNYLIIPSEEKLFAYNLRGAIADNFPLTISDDEFNGSVLAADIEGDTKSEVIAFTNKGNIYAINGGSGKAIDGFPISTGKNNTAYPMLFSFDGSICLGVLDSTNNFYAWKISPTQSRLDWSELYSDRMNSSFLKNANSVNRIEEFFPKSRAYNYPNPVYEGTTAIRYYVSENSKINIKILDLAGELVAELNDYAIGGFDNETIWNVSNIQSGVYLARIEAATESGKSDNMTIKIAVIK
ncbi:T9SS type A sorting domain-containing protein [Ignavibacterium sp.]|jgi:M6 family metalloprotease-like protein|uniref:T9SS-dependent M6-like inactivated metalloprotease n=1 Tax=Ignavibacterium sp. TaxID=2651167 RepID=UPI0025C561B9|nr:T9SS type A sorting domain-containing protein [Ignavibacterium sp.]